MSDLKKFYTDYGISKIKKKDMLEAQELYQLYKSPKKDRGVEMPHFFSDAPNGIHQADLLFLPTDDGYKYALVVVDVATRAVDARPLKDKNSKALVGAFKSIYKGPYLKEPYVLQVDAGKEFQGDLAYYLEKQGIAVRTAQPSRHRQQGLVERKNYTIGSTLLKRMTAQELLTGETSREWVEDLPTIIKAMNNNKPKVPKPPNGVILAQPTKKQLKAINAKYKTKTAREKQIDKFRTTLLTVGTKVRVALDEPLNVVTGKREHGKFRAGDIKFNPKIRTIKQVILKPGSPVLYLLDGTFGKNKVDNVAYTFSQLQVYNEKEEAPPGLQVVRGKPTKYNIKAIIGHKTIKKVKYLLVEWKGYSKQTYEPESEIRKDQPDLVNKYYQSIN